MQNHTRDAVNIISCLKSHGLAYQRVTVTKGDLSRITKRTNHVVIKRVATQPNGDLSPITIGPTLWSPSNGLPHNQMVIFLGSQKDQHFGLHQQTEPMPWFPSST